jgi:hypothetical protein
VPIVAAASARLVAAAGRQQARFLAEFKDTGVDAQALREGIGRRAGILALNSLVSATQGCVFVRVG